MFEYAIRVLADGIIKLEGIRTAKNNIAELQQAISILEKAVTLNDLFKDAIVVGEKAYKK